MKTRPENLFEKFRKGTLSEAERRDLFSLFHNEDLEFELKNELLEQLTNMPDSASSTIKIPDFDLVWAKMNQSEPKRTKTSKTTIRLWYSAAAVLIIGLLISNLLVFTKREQTSGEFFSATAPKGSVSQFMLPDSTVIFLNSGSQLKYLADNTNQKIREVYLSGEAWFKVKKSETVPFLVHTPYYNVRVMGTEFNVKAYENDRDIVTTLEEGSIKVQSSEALKLSDEITLVSGEQLIYNRDAKTVQVQQVKAPLYSSWKENKLIFINTSLKDLVTLLERKYGVEIELQDNQISNYHYDGTIKNETLLEVLDLLGKTLPIEYTVEGQKIVITKK